VIGERSSGTKWLENLLRIAAGAPVWGHQVRCAARGAMEEGWGEEGNTSGTTGEGERRTHMPLLRRDGTQPSRGWSCG
jgi:hypothetical protein